MKMPEGATPSPALVVAVLALSMALVGTAVAGTDGFSRALNKSKVKTIAKAVAKKQINKREKAVNFALSSSSGATVVKSNGLKITVACSGGSALSLNATTTSEANFASSTTALNSGTVTNVNQTQGLFDPGDNLNPTGGADLNGAMVRFEYGSFEGGTVSGQLMTDEFAAGGAACRVSGTVLSG
jgi:hypothetical protein